MKGQVYFQQLNNEKYFLTNNIIYRKIPSNLSFQKI